MVIYRSKAKKDPIDKIPDPLNKIPLPLKNIPI